MDFVRMRHPATGGEADMAAGAVDIWRGLGWVVDGDEEAQEAEQEQEETGGDATASATTEEEGVSRG